MHLKQEEKKLNVKERKGNCGNKKKKIVEKWKENLNYDLEGGFLAWKLSLKGWKGKFGIQDFPWKLEKENSGELISPSGKLHLHGWISICLYFYCKVRILSNGKA